MWDLLARRLPLLCALLALLIFSSRTAIADVFTNITPGPDLNWSTTSNWLNGQRPAVGGSYNDSIILHAAALGVNLDEFGDTQLNRLTLNNTLVNGFTFGSSGSGYNLKFGGTNPAIEAQAPLSTPKDLLLAMDMALDFALANGVTVTPNQNNLTLNGVISGNSGFIIAPGPGTVTFSNSVSTFTGGIKVNTGATIIAGGDSFTSTFGPFGAGTVTLENNATFGTLNDSALHTLLNLTQINDAATISGRFAERIRLSNIKFNQTPGPNVVQNLSVNGSLTVQGTLSGAAFNKNGPGTLIITSTSNSWNTQGAPIIFTDGLTQFSSNGNFGVAANPLQLNGGALQNTADVPLTHTLNIGSAGGTITNTMSFGVARTLTVPTLTGTGPLNKTGAGTLSLGDTSGYTGTVRLHQGTLQLNAANGLGGGKFYGDAGSQLILTGSTFDAAKIILPPGQHSEDTGMISMPSATLLANIPAAFDSGYYIGTANQTNITTPIPTPARKQIKIARNIRFVGSNIFPANTDLLVGSRRNGIGGFPQGGNSGGGFVDIDGPNSAFNGNTYIWGDYSLSVSDTNSLGSGNGAIYVGGITAWNTDPAAPSPTTRSLYGEYFVEQNAAVTEELIARLKLLPGSRVSFNNFPTTNANRVPDSATWNLNGTSLALTGGFSAVTENTGPVKFDGPSELVAASNTSATTFKVSTLTRTNRGVLNILQSGPGAVVLVNDLPNSPAMQTANGFILPFISTGNAAAARYDPVTGFTAVTAATPGVITSLASPASTDFAVLSGAQTVTANIQLGRLQLGGTTYEITGPGIINLGTGTVEFVGINSNATSVNLNNDLNILPAAELIVTTAGNLQFKGKVTATNGLTLGGQGVATLSGPNNDVTGPITLQSGMLKLMSPLGHSNPLAISNMAILNLQTDQSFSALSGGGTIGNNGLTLSTFTLNNTSDQTFPGSFIANVGLTKTGTGTLTLTGNSNFQGPTTVNGGTLIFTPSQHASSGLNINGGTVQLAGVNDTLRIPFTNQRSGSAWVGILNLDSDSMVVGAATGGVDIPSQINQGSNLGTWNGTGGITSSAAQASVGTGTLLALGYATGSEFTAGNGQALFNGLSFLPDDTLVMLTLSGDANMDRSVTFTDFLSVQNFYNQPGTNWVKGDFNGDGSTTFIDFLTQQNNYNKTNVTGPLIPAGSSSVPEPASLLIILIPLAQLGLRSRRNHANKTRSNNFSEENPIISQ